MKRNNGGASFILKLCVVWSMCVGGQGFAENLFQAKGKTYREQDLPAKLQTQLYNLQKNYHESLQQIADSALLDLYFSEVAKKQGKKPEEVAEQELHVKQPTEAEVKKFYEQVKNRIPPQYSYEQVKPQLQNALVQQKQGEARAKLLEKIKKTYQYKFLVQEPTAPVIKINTSKFHKKGKPGAKIQLIEFADYHCPHCKAFAPVIKEFMKRHKDDVEFVYIDFPLHANQSDKRIAEGAYCAGKQGKFWEYHDMAFEKQNSLTTQSAVEFAKSLGLEVKGFEKCLKSAEAKSFVAQSKEEGVRVGVQATPTIFINGRLYDGEHTREGLEGAIKALR